MTDQNDTITESGYNFPHFGILQALYESFSRNADRCGGNPVLRAEWLTKRTTLLDGYLIGAGFDLATDPRDVLSEMLHDGYIAACERWAVGTGRPSVDG